MMVPVFEANAQQTAASSELPPIVVNQQTAKPVAKPATASVKSKKPAKPSTANDVPAVAPAPESAATVQPDAEPAEVVAERAAAGVASTGLGVPATTTTLRSQSLAPDRVATSDTASLLTRAAGVSIYQAGAVSGLPAINGLNDDRVKILLNGMAVSSACANHMNPPLSYADPAQVARIEVVAGVTPVSKGGDSIAGTVIVDSAPPHFAHAGEGAHAAGTISTFYRSNGDQLGTSATAHAATDRVSVDYAGAWARGYDYKDGNGERIASTEYEAQNHSAQVAIKNGGDLFVVQGGLQFIPYQGYVNQRMDMVDNETWFLNMRYLGKFSWGKLDARAFYQHVEHMMDFLPDKKYNLDPMMAMMMPNGRKMPMRTDAEDAGYSIKAEINVSDADTLRIGNEFHHYAIDDWWPPVAGMGMMCCDTYQVLNGATRDRLGTFIEWERQWDRAWSTLLGVRNDMVWMDTGNVQGYNAGAVYGPDAYAFNARDHARTDTNFDATALLRYEPSRTSLVELGYAMKMRSPNLYERYAWSSPVGDTAMTAPQMALNMLGWFGDGNGYTGNLDLKPERAHTASITLGWHSGDGEYGLKVTPYYTYVEDYIGVRKLGDSFGAAHAGFVNLQFTNHDAELYGVNITGAMPLGVTEYGKFALTGVASYVHGENADTGVSLYHMMPFNTRLALTHRFGGWSSAVELDLVAGKHNVDTTRNELETGAYALVNLRTSYEWERWRFDLGVTNLFDTYYEHPLGGIYIEPSMGNRDPALGPREVGNVPSPGRSINVGMTLKF
ncbi:MAG: TonB-dependent receptor [Hyphomicrobiaceae bacterium]|nr:TonB-dependent receptor [Hyphomicrobiaceae bacterium]